jgi:hypothetical protein
MDLTVTITRAAKAVSFISTDISKVPGHFHGNVAKRFIEFGICIISCAIGCMLQCSQSCALNPCRWTTFSLPNLDRVFESDVKTIFHSVKLLLAAHIGATLMTQHTVITAPHPIPN